MIGEVVITVVCIAVLVFGAWSLIRLLKDRQASDRSYNGDNGCSGMGGEG